MKLNENKSNQIPTPPFGGQSPPLVGGKSFPSLRGRRGRGFSCKKSPWQRATRGWLDFRQVRPPRMGAAGCSPVELACLACKLASKPHRWVVRGGAGPRIRRLVTFARHVVQADTCSLAVSGQETRHVRSGGGTTAHPLRGASTPWTSGVSQGASTRTHTCLLAWDFPSQGGDSPTLGEIPWHYKNMNREKETYINAMQKNKEEGRRRTRHTNKSKDSTQEKKRTTTSTTYCVTRSSEREAMLNLKELGLQQCHHRQ